MAAAVRTGSLAAVAPVAAPTVTAVVEPPVATEHQAVVVPAQRESEPPAPRQPS
jgi:hypothetical protein